MLLFFLSEPTSRPSILDTIQNYTEKPGNTFSRGCLLSISTRLRLRLTYIRPDWVNVNNNILSVALWRGAMYITRNPDDGTSQNVLQSTICSLYCNFKAKINANRKN